MHRIEKLKEYLLAQPGDSFLQHALALEYIKLGEEQQAKQLFEQLLANHPGYVGSYYHLAKLLERIGEKQQAIATYEAGMLQAKEANDKHAYSELQMALDDLIDD
jgi:Tfp pilus assembly protein PilF